METLWLRYSRDILVNTTNRTSGWPSFYSIRAVEVTRSKHIPTFNMAGEPMSSPKAIRGAGAPSADLDLYTGLLPTYAYSERWLI